MPRFLPQEPGSWTHITSERHNIMVTLDPKTGHVDPGTLDWQKRGGFLGIGYKVSIVSRDVVDAEHIIEPDPKYAPIEAYVADAVAFATHGQWSDVATSSANVIAQGVAIGNPEFAAVANTCVALLQAVVAKNLAGVEAALLTLGEDVLSLIPSLGVKVITAEAVVAVEKKL
jgi:hypothetical protein